jgi:molybdopterin molybdotransferase
MTGAPLPEGADAIIPVEKTEPVDRGGVRLLQLDIEPGQHVMPRGASMRAGDVVVRAESFLRPLELAILAEAGQAFVTVRPRPRVCVLPTGNELVSAEERPGPGQIRNSNGPMLVAAAKAAGADADELPVARDVREELVEKVRRGLAADVLLLSGGVSAGKYDLVPGVLAELEVQQVFHKVSLRPGRPLWFGTYASATHRALVFGLPGNPVSSFVCFELFVRPAIAAMCGRGFVGAPQIPARLGHDYDHNGRRAACLPARLSSLPSGPRVEILPWLGSADLAALARANGLVRLPAEPMHLPAGAPVDVLLI